jgi:hypothetical protein
MATGYTNTFITVAPDCPVAVGIPPAMPTSIAGLEHAFLVNAPYELTGDDLIFAVYLRHKGIGDDADLQAIRTAYFLKPHPCLRASMLPKRYGWGAHFDAKGRIAIYGAQTDDYRRFSTSNSLKVIPAMRNRKP